MGLVRDGVRIETQAEGLRASAVTHCVTLLYNLIEEKNKQN